MRDISRGVGVSDETRSSVGWKRGRDRRCSGGSGVLLSCPQFRGRPSPAGLRSRRVVSRHVLLPLPHPLCRRLPSGDPVSTLLGHSHASPQAGSSHSLPLGSSRSRVRHQGRPPEPQSGIRDSPSGHVRLGNCGFHLSSAPSGSGSLLRSGPYGLEPTPSHRHPQPGLHAVLQPQGRRPVQSHRFPSTNELKDPSRQVCTTSDVRFV